MATSSNSTTDNGHHHPGPKTRAQTEPVTLKILIAHNDYGRYSGEEAVVDRMIADLRSLGHEVDTLRPSSQHHRDTLWGKTRGFFAGIYSLAGRRAMRRKLRQFRPDVVNIHNLYPFLSPAVLPLCRKAGVPVVMTVHNYRLVCPTGLFLRDGHPCENCLQNGNERDCLRYNCEHSRLRSLGYALRNAVARRTRAYLDNVDLYCCLSEFQRQKLIAAGFDSHRIAVIPNYIEPLPESDEPDGDTQGYVAYVGRLSEEKGFDLLLHVARRHPEIPFRFAGTLREGLSVEPLPNVTMCGQIDRQHLAQFYRGSRFVVIPSRCYEGFPVALLEAASVSRCCIAPDHGAFRDMMTDNNGNLCGLLFRPLDIDDLEDKIVYLWNNNSDSSTLGEKASQNLDSRFRKEKTIGEWNLLLERLANKSETINEKSSD